MLDTVVRDHLIASDASSADVIKPYLIGKDVNREVDQQPTRFIIDFNQMTEQEARQFKAAFKYVQKHVYPSRTSDIDRKTARAKEKWWLFKIPAPDMRNALENLESCLATPCVSPHVLVVRTNTTTLADHQLKVIALDSDYHFGILQSAVHEYWAWARGSTLEERLRYTNTTIFETFPFPLLSASD
ncbi:MAG: hypothetical protein M3R04_10430, partial [bacterium]|nr:hypothetical protein [bacterium]